MNTLVITRGLPASGKTTFARDWMNKDPRNRVRINRDDMRLMLVGADNISNGTIGTLENPMSRVRDAMIKQWFEHGVSVVIDDTNLPNRYVRDLKRLAEANDAAFEIYDFTDVRPALCVERDKQRADRGERSVGSEVIYDMFERFIKGRPHPLPITEPEVEDTFEDLPYVPPEIPTRDAVLVDIDGTIANMGARHPFDWARVGDDTPIQPVIDMVTAFYNEGYEIIFVSGRSDVCREETEDWIVDHTNLTDFELHMRKEGDFRRDVEVKREIFDSHLRMGDFHIKYVLDDRDQVVEYWRSIGLTCLQVAPGSF